jgi:hypothetical protein
MLLIIALVIGAVVLVTGLVVGAWLRGRLLLPSDRERLGVLASELHAQARMDAMTRATAQAMRDAARGQ